MAFTAFVSKSKPGNQVHNEREFDADHPEPSYFLPAEHRQENIHITTGLTDKQVYRDYVRTTDYGRKSKRLHHSAKPVREAIIVCKMDTTEKQVRTLIKELETGLGIRALHAHVHKDEGHIDKKTGKVKHNPHIHFGYTNLVIERGKDGKRHGRLTDMKRDRMSKAQDICARVLKMERAPHYTKETRKKNLPHQAYRAKMETEAKVQAALDAAETKTVEAETTATNLVELNKRLRQELKASGFAQQDDYKGLKQIKDSDLPEDERQTKMVEYVIEAVARAEKRAAEKRAAEEQPIEEQPTTAPRPKPLPVTPPRKRKGSMLYEFTGGIIGKPPRRRRLPAPAVKTPDPEPVPAEPVFADVLRNWRQHETAKREAAVKEARLDERKQAQDDLKKLDEKYVKKYNKLQEDLGFWKKATIEARDLVKTLSRFILALDKGFKTAWPRHDVAEFARDLEPGPWFKDTEIVTFSKKLNDKVDYFNAASMKPKTQVRQTPAPTPTKALDDDEQDL